MELGEKLREARLEAGLSQRQLCEGIVTRNMLSQIEHGSAKPSMKTLGQLAARLGKNISFFLEETAVLSPNQAVMEAARRSFDGADFSGAIAALEDYRQPDPVYDREFPILWNLSHIGFARQQMALGKQIYAKELLQKADLPSGYCAGEMERQRLLLLGQLGERVGERLPSLDTELLLRAKEAPTVQRTEKLLEAAQDQTSEEWLLLRGWVHLKQKQFSEACRCFHGAENGYPRETAALLEEAYRELGDYKKAYYYACKQKDKGKG